MIKDGNGNGTIGAEDTNIVIAAANQELPFRAFSGDYYTDDDVVDGDTGSSDRMAHHVTFGQQVDNETDGYLEADGNFNGVVDAADEFVPWVFRNNYSAWSTGPPPGGGGGGSPPTQVGIAPRVTNVVVSGSSSLHAPFSFDSVDGSGEQLRTVPVGRADTISITFSEGVNVQADDLKFVGLRTALRPALTSFTYDVSTVTATWWFFELADANPWMADHFMISLSDRISDVEGDRLDGEWTNPASITTSNASVSEFPSGDGTAGGDFNFVITLLPGDVDLNNVVDNDDLNIVIANLYGWGTTLWTDGDVSGDLWVDAGDYDAVAEHIGIDLQSVWVLADLNADDRVDEDDLEIIYDNRYLPNPTQADGDLDGDGDIDLDDVDLAFAQIGLELSIAS
jgi:hypothetical protein